MNTSASGVGAWTEHRSPDRRASPAQPKRRLLRAPASRRATGPEPDPVRGRAGRHADHPQRSGSNFLRLWLVAKRRRHRVQAGSHPGRVVVGMDEPEVQPVGVAGEQGHPTGTPPSMARRDWLFGRQEEQRDRRPLRPHLTPVERRRTALRGEQGCSQRPPAHAGHYPARSADGWAVAPQTDGGSEPEDPNDRLRSRARCPARRIGRRAGACAAGHRAPAVSLSGVSANGIYQGPTGITLDISRTSPPSLMPRN